MPSTVKCLQGIIVILLLATGVGSCKRGPQPFALGKDACEFCKMTLMEPKFGGELITKKGKIYKFDDLHCMIAFMKKEVVKKENIDQTLTIDYSKPNTFLNAFNAFYLISENLHSPMNSNAASFATQQEAEVVGSQFHGNITNWQTLFNEAMK